MSNAHTSMLQAIATARAARIDPPCFDPKTGREEALVVVEVEPRAEMQVIPNGNLAYGGRLNHFTVYESQAAQILAMVEDASPAQLAEVDRELDRQIARWCAANPERAREGGRPGFIHFYSCFNYIMGRDLRPLISARILGPAT